MILTMRERALIAVAKNYWRRGTSIQYETELKDYGFKAEWATSTHPCYTVCSAFLYNVFKQALDVTLPIGTVAIGDATKNTPYSIYYESYNGRVKTKDKLKAATLASKMRAGDILNWNLEDHGHCMMMYDHIKSNGKIVDAWMIHAGGASGGVREESKSEYDSRMTEGSVRISRLSTLLAKQTYITRVGILRLWNHSSITLDGIKQSTNTTNYADLLMNLDGIKATLRKESDMVYSIRVDNLSNKTLEKRKYEIFVPNDAKVKLYNSAASGIIIGNTIAWERAISPKSYLIFRVRIDNAASLKGKNINARAAGLELMAVSI